MGYVFVPANPTSNKEELVGFVASLIINDILKTDGQQGLELLKSYNNASLQALHDYALKQFDYKIANYIKKSLKLSYGTSRVFGLSSIDRTNYITDLRKAIQRY